MSATLKLIATPIGNIRDFSPRAISEIKKAKVILAEDTRHSLSLFQALGIELDPDCRMISCHSQKEKDRIDVVLERLTQNTDVILVSDAGCPTISDPGSRIVEAVAQNNFRIEVLPGPSAQSAAIMGAGLNTTRFAFLGFLPQKNIARKQLIENAARAELALVIYESPLRVSDLLAELFEYLGERRVVVARELTKIHETFHRGVLGEDLSPPLVEKGECVVVVEAGEFSEPVEQLSESIEEFIAQAIKGGQKTKEIAAAVAKKFNLKKSNAYDRVVEQIKSN